MTIQINFGKQEKKRTIDQEWSIVLPNPPESITVDLWEKKGYGGWSKSKRVKKSLTANIWYGSSGSKNDIIVKSTAKKAASWFLQRAVKAAPLIDCIVRITVIYYHPKYIFDIDNKGYFWGKLYTDYLKRSGKIPEDNTKWVQEVVYRFEQSEDHRIEFKITKIGNAL